MVALRAICVSIFVLVLLLIAATTPNATAVVQAQGSTSTATATATRTSTLVPTATWTTSPATATWTAAATVNPTTALPTPTKTVTPVVVTATPTRVPSTNTPTSVAVTRTATLVPPTSTATKPAATATPTKAPPTATRTNTPATKSGPRAARAGVVSSLSTAFTVQNIDATNNADISLGFYNNSGSVVSTLTRSLQPYRASLIDQRDPVNGGLGGVGSPWSGSVVLSSTVPIAAVVNQYSGAGLGLDFRADSYGGVPGAGASTSVQLPQVLKNIYDAAQNKTYNSTIAIQNTSLTTAADVTLILYDLWGGGTYTRNPLVVQPGTSVYINMQDQFNGTNGLPNIGTFYGAGAITSSQPVAVIVNQNAAGALLTYAGFTTANASSTLYVSQLLSNIYDPLQAFNWGTGMMVMAADRTRATVSVTYTDGRTGYQVSETQVASPAATFDQRASYSPVAGNFYGSAIITADKPVVALVNMVTDYNPARGARMMTYRGFASGNAATRLFFPQLLKNYADAGSGVIWSTGIALRLMGGACTTVTITYYLSNGTTRSSSQYVCPSNPMLTFDQRYDSSLADLSTFIGSAVISASQPIVATTNGVGDENALGDASTNYAGISP